MGGQISIPLVYRAPIGATGRAAQHSQSLEAWFMHTPGLKVVMPSTPYDAKGLLKSAIRDENPVIFLEHKLLYGAKSPGGKAKTAIDDLGEAFKPAPDEDYLIPLGQADIKRYGDDVTIVATSLMVHKSLKAAEQLSREGVEIEVIDPRTVKPLDTETIINSVKKTSRLVIATESNKNCGFSAEIAAIIADEAIMYLDAPVKRVAVDDTPIPFAPIMEHNAIPNENSIIDTVRQILA